MKALTRKEIIEIWSEQEEAFLNSFCCPECRDILLNDGMILHCSNYQCRNIDHYDIETGDKIDD